MDPQDNTKARITPDIPDDTFLLWFARYLVKNKINWRREEGLSHASRKFNRNRSKRSANARCKQQHRSRRLANEIIRVLAQGNEQTVFAVRTDVPNVPRLRCPQAVQRRKLGDEGRLLLPGRFDIESARGVSRNRISA